MEAARQSETRKICTRYQGAASTNLQPSHASQLRPTTLLTYVLEFRSVLVDVTVARWRSPLPRETSPRNTPCAQTYDGQTDKHDEDNSRFRNFANAPHKSHTSNYGITPTIATSHILLLAPLNRKIRLICLSPPLNII